VFAHRSDNLKEMAKSAKFLYQDFEGYEPQAVDKNLRYPAEHALRKLYESLSELSEWHAEAINDVFKIVHKSTGLSLSKIAQPLRVVVSGTAVSPPIDVTLELLGKQKTLARIESGLLFMSKEREKPEIIRHIVDEKV
jgi:glutamyl-tRNA synthetase